jgi:hypothetical protein
MTAIETRTLSVIKCCCLAGACIMLWVLGLVLKCIHGSSSMWSDVFLHWIVVTPHCADGSACWVNTLQIQQPAWCLVLLVPVTAWSAD